MGAFCHVVLPDSGGAPPNPQQPACYADHAVAWALAALSVQGAGQDELVAKLAGGARILDLSLLPNVGAANVAATRAALGAAGIPVVDEETGGTQGRTVRFWPGSGVLEVRSTGGPRRIL